MAAMPQTSRDRATPVSFAGAVTIHAAFFEEAKEVHFEVSAKVKQIMAFGRQQCWTDAVGEELTKQLHPLLELIDLSFSLEEADGSFENPIFVEASYSRRVSDLRGEHNELLSELSRLCNHHSQ